MTKPKYYVYSLWLKWSDQGWQRFMTVEQNARHSYTAREIIRQWVKISFVSKWPRRKWMILPKHKIPAALRGGNE